MSRKKIKRKLTTVIWEDTVAQNSMSLSNVKKGAPVLVSTHGELIKSKIYYFVRTSRCEFGGDNDDWVKIPASLIRSVITYREANTQS